jgi:acetyl-CoA/propionyl-CoA carboxylase carboxyl transferase subunit
VTTLEHPAPAAGPGPTDPRDPVTRLAALLDPDSMSLVGERDGSGAVAAHGRIDGAEVVAYCTDAARQGGAMGTAGCTRIVEAIGSAERLRVPVIGMWHSGGARLAEGVASLDGVGRVFAAMVRASGRVPQLSVMLGPAAGGAAYGAALTDLVIMAPDSRVFVTGPDVIRTVTGELVDQESLGGPAVHASRSGVVHVVADSEADALARTRTLTGFFTRPGTFAAPDLAADRLDLRGLLPESSRRAYDVRPLVRGLLDPVGPFMELQPRWAPNMVTGLGRLAGRAVGVLANNPLRLGGCLDSTSAEKAARFVRLCDAFGIPLVVLVDVPGYLPGVDEEWGGVVRRGAKLLHAFAEACVPRVTLVTRKAFGGAYVAMNSTALGATAVYAWPDAQVAVMGADAAVGILHRKALAAAPDADREDLRRRLAREHETTVGGLHRATDLGVVDAVIDPADTRAHLVAALAAAPARRGTHTNIPL